MKTGEVNLADALTLLEEIADSGYLKTKHTSDETNLEERLDNFVSDARSQGYLR